MFVHVSRSLRRTGALAVALSTVAFSALAQTPPAGEAPQALPATREQQPAAPPEEVSKDGIWERDQLLGDPGGVRSWLEEDGVTLGPAGNQRGAGQRQRRHQDRARSTKAPRFMGLKVDTDAAFGLPGGTFWASAYQIHGRGLSANNLDNLNIVSSIEATRATRLFELWYEQKLLDGVGVGADRPAGGRPGVP